MVHTSPIYSKYGYKISQYFSILNMSISMLIFRVMGCSKACITAEHFGYYVACIYYPHALYSYTPDSIASSVISVQDLQITITQAL